MNSTVPIPSMGSPSGYHKLITLTSAGRARAQHRQKTAKGFPRKAGRSTSGGCHTSFEVSKEGWSRRDELTPCTPASSWGDVVAIESRNPCPGLMDCIRRRQVAAGSIQDRDCWPSVHTNIPPLQAAWTRRFPSQMSTNCSGPSSGPLSPSWPSPCSTILRGSRSRSCTWWAASERAPCSSLP